MTSRVIDRVLTVLTASGYWTWELIVDVYVYVEEISPLTVY